ncbi:MAG: 4Fe-4S dicluster domain-containing protein [Chloroflexi bacterium]|nr:4Fe-4S dicluster domain-containing protein [Chloroflexota bacterium]
MIDEVGITRAAQACYQCGRCGGGCPFAFAMEHTPRLLVRLLQLGRIQDAQSSNTIWLCASCHSCSVSCPRGVDLAGLMYRLKQMAVTRGIVNDNIWFYREFVRNIGKRGLVYEPELMLGYARRVGWQVLLPHVRMGLEMAQRRKLTPPPPRLNEQEVLSSVIAEILQGSATK